MPPTECITFNWLVALLHGRPDFAHRGARVAVFLDGCFWHGCPEHHREPETNPGFWRAKIERNRARDREVTQRLREEGWRVIRVWEHEFWGRVRAGSNRGGEAG